MSFSPRNTKPVRELSDHPEFAAGIANLAELEAERQELTATVEQLVPFVNPRRTAERAEIDAAALEETRAAVTSPRLINR